MARPFTVSDPDLLLRLQAGGAASSAELAAAAGVTRVSVNRALARLGDAVVTVGETRRARHLARRNVRQAGNHWPLYRLDEDGRAQPWAELEAFHGAWRVSWAGEAPAWSPLFADREDLWSGFPFFLGDIRPQGFLGRALARGVSAALGLPADPRQWDDDDTLVFLQARGEDQPGNVVVGEACVRRALAGVLHGSASGRVTEPSRSILYPRMAGRAAGGETIGTSAGGEQPKFSALLERSDGELLPVLVKFSPPLETPNGRRWADLLCAEGHAHRLLARAGLSAGEARLLDAGGRRFLEVPRFDRTPQGGRRGVVSLEALHAAGVGTLAHDWPHAVAGLVREGLTDAATLRDVARLHAFGELIGNSDMHAGNLAFWLADTLPFRLAPSYDMLPMLFAPGASGEVIDRPFRPLPPAPENLPVWREAAAWAEEFWSSVAEDPAVSEDFAERCREALREVAGMRERL